MGFRRGGGWWPCGDRAAGCSPPAAWRGPSRQAQAQGPSSDFPALPPPGGPRGTAEPPHRAQARDADWPSAPHCPGMEVLEGAGPCPVTSAGGCHIRKAPISCHRHPGRAGPPCFLRLPCVSPPRGHIRGLARPEQTARRVTSSRLQAGASRGVKTISPGTFELTDFLKARVNHSCCEHLDQPRETDYPEVSVRNP